MDWLILAVGLLLSLPTLTSASSSSPIAYDIILVIVILELIFAFSVAVVCILFSFNLIITLKDSSNEMISSLAVGDLPPSRIAQHQQRDSDYAGRTTFDEDRAAALDYKTFRDNAGGRGHGASFASEMDIERQLSGYEPRNENKFAALFNSFYNYIRLW